MAKKQVELPIGEKQVQKALQTFKKYKDGKHALEKKIVKNEQWYKLRHWRYMDSETTKYDPKPSSAWLFNVIMSKHADFMDSMPEPNILPRERGDKKEATNLSSIIPVVLEQNKFEQTYSDVCWYKLKNGTGCYGVFWDKGKLNGLGDISIKQVDLLNLFWEPGIKELQQSRNIFYIDLVDVDLMDERYPEFKGKFSTENSDLTKYVYDDTMDTTSKVLVIDWYYKKNVEREDGSFKTVLHYCKFSGDIVLYATENEEDMQDGLYDHALYPFIFDVLFREEGVPYGFGYVDICKEAQESIDRLNNDIEKSARWLASPRWLMRGDGSINEEEFSDMSKPIIHVDTNLADDTLRQITTQSIDDIYVTILNNKIEELKQTSGNTDASNGAASSGVTAASAIAALQEQAGKGSRDMISASYRAYEEVINLVIELIRQFYKIPRQFRIVGEDGKENFVEYGNDGLQPQDQGFIGDTDLGFRLPVFDIKISAQKQSPYSKISQNEMALQFYSNGFFNPQMSDQAIACINMMDFTGKEDVRKSIEANGTMYTTMLQMQQDMVKMRTIIDKLTGSQLNAEAVNGSPAEPTAPAGAQQMVETGALGEPKTEESAITENARAQTAQTTEPRS